jgi:putative transposase
MQVFNRLLARHPAPFPRVVLDEGIIMPNHIHGIIMIQGRGEASVPLHVSEERLGSDASPLRQRPNGTQPGSLSAIVQNSKSISIRKINAARGMLGIPSGNAITMNTLFETTRN